MLTDEQAIRALVTNSSPDEPLFYDRRLAKVVCRVAIDGTECRFVFQETQNRNSAHLERVLSLLSKERPEQVFLPLAPFPLTTFHSGEEIDEALFKRYSGKKDFKVGAEARLVYEKVSGLKRVSINQSTLYNFCSEGVFSQLQIPVTLYRPSIGDSVRIAKEQMSRSSIHVDDLLRNVQAQILLDRLEWIGSEVLRSRACPRCDSDKVDTGPEKVNPAFIDHISAKMLPKETW